MTKKQLELENKKLTKMLKRERAFLESALVSIEKLGSEATAVIFYLGKSNKTKIAKALKINSCDMIKILPINKKAWGLAIND